MRKTVIGLQLKAWRAARDLSQRALAELAGMPYPAIARLELGQIDPRLSTLERLAEALDVDMVTFLAGPKAKKRRVR